MVIIDIIRLNCYKIHKNYLNSHNSFNFVLNFQEIVIIDTIRLNYYKICRKLFKFT
jgi:hypothetical protein